eukprot:5158563-Lingulodinium_polyedra.AAC.1
MQEKIDEQSATIEQLQFATFAPSLSGGAGYGTGNATASRGPAVAFGDDSEGEIGEGDEAQEPEDDVPAAFPSVSRGDKSSGSIDRKSLWSPKRFPTVVQFP